MRVFPRLILIGLLGACAPHIDPATKASIDTQIAKLRPGEQQYGPPTATELAPLAAGQWIKQHVVDKDGNHSLMTTKILEVQGERVWFESETETYSGRTAMKVLVTLGDRTDPSNIDVFAYWLKHADGRVEQFPPFALDAIKPTLRSTLANLTVRRATDGQEDVTVPAGQFAQAYKARVSLKALGGTFVSDTWWHPDVPLNGGVKSVGIDPRGSMELIAFGTSGAKSVFP